MAIPKISSDFHSLQDAAWYGTAYLLTITAFQPIYGSMYKLFKTDIVYRTSIIIFECKTSINLKKISLKVANFLSGYSLMCRRSVVQYVHHRKSYGRSRSSWNSSGHFEHHWPSRRVEEETTVYGSCD